MSNYEKYRKMFNEDNDAGDGAKTADGPVESGESVEDKCKNETTAADDAKTASAAMISSSSCA